ncbi:CHAT domain-containing protein [Kitasatospora sp. RB6PN24]|uniref:CHAT domain-containing protein n=1 Tax=Kitasatospora humi TaxID=2893891 RepID=UPI001E3A27D5|nr:CHAT domain-containing protein [Kitasatospora humi]MCC9311812.1 CHAT domain-containing protein [Kitasatospora humi]
MTAPLLLASSDAEIECDPPESAAPLLAEAQRVGAFEDSPFGGSRVILLPRRLLPIVLTRDLDRDLENPRAAYEQLLSEEPPTAANYGVFLELLANDRGDAPVRELLGAVLKSLPNELAELVSTHPELTDSTQVRDAGRAELRDVAGTKLEPLLRMRQQLLDDLCDNQTPRSIAFQRYFESLNHLGGDLRARLFELHHRARNVHGPEGIPLVREALALAAQLGEEDLETDLAIQLGIHLLTAVRSGLDADLAEAIRLLDQALGRLPEGSPRWVEVANNLAGAHHLRADGDRLEVWEAAREPMARAIRVLDRSARPEIWAQLQTNYGLLLSERPGGGPAAISLGIDHIRAGLEERSPERNTVDWAYSMLNLGLLLRRRAEPEDLQEAERHYREGLQQLSSDDDPLLWSQLQCNLADLLLSRDPADAAGAREAATAALRLTTTRPGLLNASRVMWLLARASDHLDAPHRAEGIRLRREALAAAPPLVSPALHLGIGGELLDAYASAERWTEAADVAFDMLTALDALYDAQVTVAGRRSVLARSPRLARWAAFLLARAGRPEHAVEAIERGLARQLSVLVGRGSAELEALEQIDAGIARRYRLAQTQYRTSVAEPSAANPGGLAPGAIEQATAERGLRTVIDEIRAIPGFERFLRTTELLDIARAAGGIPLAYLVNAPWGSYVLVLSRSPADQTPDVLPTVRAIPVPEVSSVTITRFLLVDWLAPEATGAGGLLLAQAASSLRRRTQIMSALSHLDLLEPLVRPIAELLLNDPQHEAVVIPTGLLGLVPLHAAPLGAESDEVLDDIGTLSFSPSAVVYASSKARAAQLPREAPRLVAVADPDGSLPGSRSEVAEILTMFQPFGEARCTVGREATVSWMLDHLTEASYLHLGCHGGAGLGSQGGSLLLADGRLDIETLTRHQLPDCRLTVASACQSGHYAIDETPDEFLGLPAGFLQAGAACAVTSLWQVDDLATAVLMTHFYELLFPARSVDSLPPVAALRGSRAWLRRLTWDDLAQYASSHPHLAALLHRHVPRTATSRGQEVRPFASPFHWAAFSAWGV